MVKLVLDSDIIIDFLRTNKGVLPELVEKKKKGTADLYISVATEFELLAGRMAKIQERVVNEIVGEMKVITFGREEAQMAGNWKRLGIGLSLGDLIVGATTVVIGGKLVTRNKKHFEQIPGIKFF